MSEFKSLVMSMDSIIFDMDGTLVNTEPLHFRAASIVLKDLGINIDLEAHFDKFYGMTDTAVLKISCPELNDKEISDAITMKNIQLTKLFSELTTLQKELYTTPGLFQFLKFLKDEKKQIAVVSASEDIIVEETLKYFDLDTFMDIKMGRQQTNLTKPHPEPYLEGMKRLNTTPGKTLIFEDSPTGLQSAVACGARVIRITGFAHSGAVLHSEERKNFIF